MFLSVGSGFVFDFGDAVRDGFWGDAVTHCAREGTVVKFNDVKLEYVGEEAGVSLVIPLHRHDEEMF